MKMVRPAYVVSCVALITAAGSQAARAQEPAGATPSSAFPSFDAVDANLDGAISRAELARELPDVENPGQLFAEADTDGDGQIDREEWAAWRALRVSGMSAPGPAPGERGNEIEVSLTDETLEGKYITDAGLAALDGNTIGSGSWLATSATLSEAAN